jgi:hypothetical protein
VDAGRQPKEVAMSEVLAGFSAIAVLSLVAVALAEASLPESRLLPFEPTPKLPIRSGDALVVTEDDDSVTVTGDTFSYTFAKANGLMTGLQVLSDDFSRAKGFALPNPYVSSERDPRDGLYAIRNEASAEFQVVEARPERVILSASGHYRSQSGESFPLCYTITHRIYIDGLDIVTLRNEVEADCELRWLSLSSGNLPVSLCPYYANLPDQAFDQHTGDYHFGPVPAENGDFLTGLFLPWFWLGNERTGVEVTTWDVSEQQFQPTEYEFADGGGMGDYLLGHSQPMFVVLRDGRRVGWENFTLRNVYLPVKAGWSVEGGFAVAVTPPKRYDPRLLGLRPVESGYGMPEEKVEQVARAGANYLESLTGFGGDVAPRPDGDEIRAQIALLHDHDIKVVPYVSANDLSHSSRAYQEHGPDWRIQPGYSYRFRTSGMCPWADGWREHFRRTIDMVVDEYDFDGVYIDQWFGMMACENEAHGCGGRFRHVNFLGLRDQLVHAYNRVKSEKPDSIIFNNTNVLPIAYITSLSDVRLVGEALDVMDLDPLARTFLYFSHRLGSQTAWSTYGSELTTEQKLSFGLLICSLLPRHPYDLANRRAYAAEQVAAFRRYRDIFRFFGVERALMEPALAGQRSVSCAVDEVYVNVYRREDTGELLLAVVNMNPKRVRTALEPASLARLGLSSGRSYAVYEPAQGKVVGILKGSELKALPVTLGAHGHMLLYIKQVRRDTAQVLFGIGADAVESQEWVTQAKALSFSLRGPADAEVDIAAFSPARPCKLTCGEDDIPFSYSAAQKLVKATVALDPDRAFRLSY